MHAARPSSPGNPAHLACISAAHAATGPCCASTTDDVAAIVRKDTAAIVVNRKLDRAVMSRTPLDTGTTASASMRARRKKGPSTSTSLGDRTLLRATSRSPTLSAQDRNAVNPKWATLRSHRTPLEFILGRSTYLGLDMGGRHALNRAQSRKAAPSFARVAVPVIR